MKNLINRNNYKLLKMFLKYEKEVNNLSEMSISRYNSYSKHLLYWAMDIPFSNANTIKPNLADYISGLTSNKTKKSFSKETWRKILGLASRFFLWGKEYEQKEFKNIPEIWIKSFHIPKSIHEKNDMEYVSLDEVKKLIALPHDSNDLATIRDKAAVAFLFLSGCRAGAFVTLPIKSVDIKNSSVKQWTDYGVKTKNNKSKTTYLFQIQDLLDVVIEWDNIVSNYLPEDFLWYPPIHNPWGHQELIIQKPGNNRQQGLNKRIKKLFNLAELPYKSAHKFRRGHTHFGISHAKNIKEYKIISLNLGHSTISITDQYYSKFNELEIKNTIQNLGKSQSVEDNLTNTEIINKIKFLFENQVAEIDTTASNYQQD